MGSFCPNCGRSLAVVDPADRTLVEVTLVSLDDPAAFPPEKHLWTTSRVRWLDVRDELPRHTSDPGSEGESGGPQFCYVF